MKRNENGFHLSTDQKNKNGYDLVNSMNENGYRETKCDIKRTATINLHRTLNETEFLSKSHSEIRKEFRKLPNPPAKDTHVAK